MSDALKTVTVNDDLTQAIAGALDPESIRAAVIAEAEKQGLAAADAQAAADKAVADKAAADKSAADEAAAMAGGFSRTEVIGGREFTFEAASELELERMVNNALKVAYAIQPTDDVIVTEPVVDAAAVQKAAEDRAVFMVDLETKFKRGEISTAEYLEQSGAMDEYLEKKGIPIDKLKNSITQNEYTQFEQSWAQATEEFKNSPAGADWPGGNKNRDMLGMMLNQLNLVDAPNKVAALAQAYAEMQRTNMIFPGEAEEIAAAAAASVDSAVVDAKAAADKAVANAAAETAAAAARTAAAAKGASTSSSLFGRSSGVSGSSGTPAATPAATIDVPKDASPAEIMDAWKKAQVSQGRDPNGAFIETFAKK